jgi:hypothetical protein
MDIRRRRVLLRTVSLPLLGLALLVPPALAQTASPPRQGSSSGQSPSGRPFEAPGDKSDPTSPSGRSTPAGPDDRNLGSGGPPASSSAPSGARANDRNNTGGSAGTSGSGAPGDGSNTNPSR